MMDSLRRIRREQSILPRQGIVQGIIDEQNEPAERLR